MTHADTKPTFSVADANRALPLVRSIVTDIVAEFTRMREIGRERRAIEVGAGDTGAAGDAKASTTPRAAPAGASAARSLLDALKAELEERSARIDGYIKELSDLGV